ncbi:MAG: polysaccharide biosynthesis tyrosine autokinase [Planctomycetota bacterium]|jgi:capsular exopolysaccharide synthesis family protein
MTMTKTTHLPPRLSGPPKQPGGPAAPGSGMTGLTPKEFVRIVRKRKWMILLIWSICTGLAVAITALWYAYFPSYTATAVLTAQPPEDVMSRIGAMFPEQVIERYKLDQAHLIEAAVLDKAVLDRRLQQTGWYRKNQDRDVVKELEDAVRVRPIADTSYIEVSMIGREKKDLPNIVNVIAETAEKFAGQIETAHIQQRITKLQAEQTRWNNQLKAITESIGTTRSAGELAGVRERRTASVMQLEMLTRQVGEAQNLQAEAEAGLQLVVQSQQDGTLVNDPEVQRALQFNPQYRALTMRLAELKTSLSSLTRRLGEDHRQVKATRMAIESAEQQAEELRNQIVSDTIRMVVQSHRMNAARAAQQLAGLLDRQNQVQTRLRDLERQLTEIARLTEEADMVRKQLAMINETLTGLQAQIRQGSDKQRQVGALLVRYPATPPREITRPRWSVNIGLGVGLGLALAFGLAFLLELTDTSIRSPGDIVRRMDLPLLGMVPHGDDLDEVVEDFRRVTLLEPHSPAAEAFRQIRTNLLFSGPAEQRQCLLVTSPAPEDGRTTVVMNLAASVAQAGHRVLVVDANFRQPAIADMFPDAKKAGLSSALVGQANWRDVVSATGVPNCDVIAAGPLPPNPAELLGSGVLGEIITEMKAEYDQILFDGSPAMVVSDASVLATQVDAVILVVRAHANSIGIVQRTAAQLRHVGAHLLGAVLQGVRTTAGGYLRKNYQTFYEYHQRSLP